MDNYQTEKRVVQMAEQFILHQNIGNGNLVLPTDKDSWYQHGIQGSYGIAIPFVICCDSGQYDKKGELHKDWEEKRVWRALTFIILSNKNVFLAMEGMEDNASIIFPRPCIDPKKYKNTSNHDSCWRSDGTSDIFRIYMEMYKECWGGVDEKLSPTPYNANFIINWGDMKFVKVEKEHPPKEDYFYNLTSIKEVKYKLVLQD